MIRHPFRAAHGHSSLRTRPTEPGGGLAVSPLAPVRRPRRADEEMCWPPATVYPFTRFFSEEVVRPRRGHRLGSSDTGRSLRSVTGMVRSVWHRTMGGIERGAADHPHDR